MTIEKS